MTKKIFIVLLFFAMFNKNVISMDYSSKGQTIDYNRYKVLEDDNFELKLFLSLYNSKINIDYQNDHEAAAALDTEADRQWRAILHLLKTYKTNKKISDKYKMISDKYDRTLFSHAAYFWSSWDFRGILSIYSLDELNALSKKCVILKKSEKDIACYDSFATPLHKACYEKNMPIIFKLLEEGASLDIPDKNGCTPYDHLKGGKSQFSFRAFPFIAREAFNNGSSLPIMPMALICAVLEKNVVNDVGQQIKEMYVKEKLQETSFLSSAKACIWKPVCVDACDIAGLIKKDEKVNEKHCLAHLMLMPQQKLTEINKELAFKEVGL